MTMNIFAVLVMLPIVEHSYMCST